MSRTKHVEYPNRIPTSPVTRPTSIHTTKSFNYPSNLNMTKVPRFSSFSQYPVIPQYNTIKQLNEVYYSRHIVHANMSAHRVAKQSFKKTEVELISTEKSENPKLEMDTTKSAETVQTIISCNETHKIVRSNSMTIITTDSKIKPIRKYSLFNNKFPEDSGNQHVEFNDIDDSACGSQVGILSTSSNYQKHRCSKQTESISTCRSKTENEKQKTKAVCKRYCEYTWRHYSPLCVAIVVFSLLLLLAVVTAITVSLINRNKTTPVTKTISTTTIVDARTLATKITDSTTKATMDMTTTANVDAIISSTTVYCGQSCLNQSWIDSTGNLAVWPFDGSYDDTTGSYNGTSSPNLPTFVTGYFGQAASFNVSAKQAMYTTFIPLNNVSFTVEAWIKPTGYPNPIDSSIAGLCPSPTLDHCLHINIRRRKLYFGFYLNDVRGTTNISLYQWIYTAFVFDATSRTQTIFLNGIQDGHANVTSVFRATSGNFTVGINEGVVTTTNNFQGYIDQLSITRRPKSSCEILERATLAAQFNFDTTSPYTDTGPNAVPTTSSNASIITGYKNEAILFTGSSSSYFQTWGFTSLGISNQAFSVTLWTKPQILSGTLVHLSTSSSGTGPTCFPLLGFASNGAIVAQVLTSNTTVMTTTGSILFAPSSWISVVQTWSSTNGLKLYVNNTLVSSVAASTFLGSETTPNYLTLGNCLSGCGGCSNGLVSGAGPFTGVIDDWRIYSRELTAVDVCTLFLVP